MKTETWLFAAGGLFFVPVAIVYGIITDWQEPLGPTALRWMRVRDERAVGLALGASAHGIGVARAVEIGRTAGAFASIAMSGTAMLGALVMPYLLVWLSGGN